MSRTIYFISVALILILERCASAGLAVSSHQTNVELSANNYRIIAANVSGESKIKGVLGLSYGFGLTANQLALIPLTQERLVYKDATRNLWENFEEKYGNASNRTLALINVRYDSETVNTLFYTAMKVVIVADVVEFR